MKKLKYENESVIHYEMVYKKGRIDIFIETDDEGNSYFIIKDFNGKLFVITDFEQLKKVLDYYKN